MHAGVSHNVLPQTGEVIINYRVLPGESLEAVKQHLEHVVLGPDAAHAKVEWSWPGGSVAKVSLLQQAAVTQLVLLCRRATV